MLQKFFANILIKAQKLLKGSSISQNGTHLEIFIVQFV